MIKPRESNVLWERTGVMDGVGVIKESFQKHIDLGNRGGKAKIVDAGEQRTLLALAEIRKCYM